MNWTPGCRRTDACSPTGSRPDNKWPCPEYDDVPYEDWLEESRSIPGEVVVLDLATGAQV